MVVSLEGEVPGGGRKGHGAKSPLCSGCFPGSEKRGPTWEGGVCGCVEGGGGGGGEEGMVKNGREG